MITDAVKGNPGIYRLMVTGSEIRVLVRALGCYAWDDSVAAFEPDTRKEALQLLDEIMPAWRTAKEAAE